MNRVSIVGRSKTFLQSLPTIFWGSPSLLLFSVKRGMKLTTDFRLVPRFRMSGAIPSLPTRLHVVAFN